jgi:hypothetical protein
VKRLLLPLLGVLAASLLAGGGAAARAPTPLPPIVFHTEHLCANRSVGSCGRGEIAVIRLDGSSRRQLTRDRVTESEPAWSFDHREIAFVRGSPSRRPESSRSAAKDSCSIRPEQNPKVTSDRRCGWQVACERANDVRDPRRKMGRDVRGVSVRVAQLGPTRTIE